jgi:hypothetical protein
MTFHIIDQDVTIVFDETKKFVRQKRCGKKQGTRKNPHAIDVDFDLNWPVKL